MLACFSAAETSFVAADRVSLIAGQENSFSFRSALFFLKNDEMFFATVVVAVNLFVTIFSSVSESFFHEGLGINLTYVVVGTTVAGFVLGELAPKTFALERSESSARIFLPVTRLFYVVVHPLVRFTALVSGTIAGAVFDSKGHSTIFQKRDLYRFLASTVDSGFFDKIESDIIRNLLVNANLPVRNIAVPRTQIVAVKLGTKVERVVDLFRKTGKSKIVVYDASIDNIVGVIHAKDIFKPAAIADDLLKDVIFVPESIPVVDLLDEFRSERVYVAVLIDEFGGTAGFVSSSDVMELFLGEVAIWTDEEHIKAVSSNQFLLAGNTEISEVENVTRTRLPHGDYTTIAGYLISELGRIPHQGEKVYVRGMEFTVMKTDGRKLDSVKLTLR